MALPACEGLPEAADPGAGTLALRARDFNWFRALIYREAGIHLRDAKQTMLAARLARRVRHLRLRSLADYVTYLETSDPDGSERRELINCVTTNKTDFFREAHHFDLLRDQVFAAVRTRAAQGGPRRLRIWSAGCSTGEEPYSLAMTIRDHFGPLVGWDLKIIASDIDTQVLASAQRGIYPDEKMRAVPDAHKRRHFLRGRGGSAGHWRVRPELSELIEFRQINLIEENWPLPGGLDAIFCRNVIIYFDRPTQQRLFARFAEQFEPEGCLFIGHSESLIGVSDRFTLIEKTVHRLRRSELPPARRPISPPRPDAVAPVIPLPCKQIIIGEVFASREPAVVRTLLGSCVSACLYDPEARVGGMNHFLLPDGDSEELRAARYGVHAMELLINEIMRLGGDRRRLVAKVFGAAGVLRAASSGVPQQNSRFVRAFLENEQIPIVGERLGGHRAIEVWFHTAVGRARIRYVDEPPPLLVEEERSGRTPPVMSPEDSDSLVTLF
jgi:chemotaxis protein methyltransferase CheR